MLPGNDDTYRGLSLPASIQLLINALGLSYRQPVLNNLSTGTFPRVILFCRKLEFNINHHSLSNQPLASTKQHRLICPNLHTSTQIQTLL